VLDSDNHPFGAVSVASPSMACPIHDFVAMALDPMMRAAQDLSRILRVSGAASAVKVSNK